MSSPYLNFKVHWTDGGQHSDAFKVTNLLENNSSTYCSSKAENVNVVFEESEGRRFRLGKIDIRTAGSGYTAPCKDALVFVCDKVPDMNEYKKFDSLTKPQFEDMKEDPLLKNATFVSFKFTSDETSVDESDEEEEDTTAKPVNISLSPLLEGKYVLVKLIRPRSGDNIDMEFVGFAGQVHMENAEDEDKRNQDVYTSRRYLVDTSGPGALSQIGMCFFASLIDSFDDEDLRSSLRKDATGGPLRQILNQLKSQRPLQLFSEWSPPRVPPQKLLKLRLEMASSTFSETSKHAKCALKPGNSHWASDKSTFGSAWWAVDLETPRCVSSIAVTWHGNSIPAIMFVESSTDNGETWTIRGIFEDKHLLRRNGKPLLLHSVKKKKSRDKNQEIVSSSSMSAKNWRLRMEGHTPKNKTKRYAIEFVQMWQQESEDVDHVSAAMSIKSIERFLLRCGLDRQDVRQGLRYLALSSGSVCSLLRLFRMCGSDDSSDKIITSALRRELRKRIKIEQDREETQRAGIQQKGVKSRNSSASFDPETASHSSVKLSEDNMFVKCETGTNASVLLDIGFESGHAAWEMLLAEDTNSQCTCFGAATKPVTNSNYERSHDLWMYRAYNGYTYNRGTRGLTLRKIYKGDIVRCELDMDAGTLRYLVNGEDQGICFTNMNEFGPVYPAVAFYSSNRAVRLLSVECTNVSQPLFLSDSLTPISADDEDEKESSSSSKMESNITLPSQAGTLGYRVRVLRDEEEENDEEENNEENDDDNDENESKEEYEDDPMIVVEEKRRSKAISTRPESQSFVRVQYELNGKYDRFMSRVGLNDTAKLNESKVRFEVLGDDKILWVSKDVTKPKNIQSFDISVLDINTLELRVHCDGSNEYAHAVWIDPVIVSESEFSVWYRKVYGPIGVKQLNEGSKHAALKLLGMLADAHLRSLRCPPSRPIKRHTQAVLDLEEPYIIEICPELFEHAEVLLRNVISKKISQIEDHDLELYEAVMLLLCANLQRLKFSYVNPASVFGDHDDDDDDENEEHKEEEKKQKEEKDADYLESLRNLLLKIISFPKESRFSKDLPAEVLYHGRRIFFPSEETRYEMALQASKSCRCIEFEMFWPVLSKDPSSSQNSKHDGTVFQAYERAMLLLQIYCRDRRWKTSFWGEWMRESHLVIEIPSSSSSSKLLRTGLKQIFSHAGFKSFEFPYGDMSSLPIRYERLTKWNRTRRRAYSMTFGCVHVYSSSNKKEGHGGDLFLDVEKEVKSFLSLK